MGPPQKLEVDPELLQAVKEDERARQAEKRRRVQMAASSSSRRPEKYHDITKSADGRQRKSMIDSQYRDRAAERRKALENEYAAALSEATSPALGQRGGLDMKELERRRKELLEENSAAVPTERRSNFAVEIVHLCKLRSKKRKRPYTSPISTPDQLFKRGLRYVFDETSPLPRYLLGSESRDMIKVLGLSSELIEQVKAKLNRGKLNANGDASEEAKLQESGDQVVVNQEVDIFADVGAYVPDISRILAKKHTKKRGIPKPSARPSGTDSFGSAEMNDLALGSGPTELSSQDNAKSARPSSGGYNPKVDTDGSTRPTMPTNASSYDAYPEVDADNSTRPTMPTSASSYDAYPEVDADV